MFEEDVKIMYDNLGGFGKHCALDGKLLDSYAKKENKKVTSKEENGDYRRENDVSWACKAYIFANGIKKSIWHHGFEVHILCDANYELRIWKKLEQQKYQNKPLLTK